MLRLVACLAAFALPVQAEGIVSAEYDDPTTRYDHGILGDAIEFGSLVLETDAGRRLRLTLPDNRVFEDTGPRVVDIDGDGQAEVIAVETDVELGARLSVYGPEGLIASNEFIGRSNRWLAPVGSGAADLDGDGEIEFIFVDRPHLVKRIVMLRRRGDKLVPFGSFNGVTNHRIGETDIAGGIRDCGNGPEMVVATADWSKVVAVSFDGNQFGMSFLADHRGRETFEAAMACRI